MAEYLIKGETLKATADAIRAKLPMEQLVIREDLIADANTFIDGAVTIAYYEYIDYGNQYGEQGAHSTDGFIAFGYLPNNEGNTVPVIFKTDLDAAKYDQEFIDPDYEDTFYYVGNVTVDGTTYNKWRKIETILDGGFTWTSEYQQYVYTNEIVGTSTKPNTEEINPVDFPEKINAVYEAGIAIGINSDIFKSLIDRSITTIDLTKFGNITTIGAYAFCQCTNLTDVILPKALELTIGEYAFYNCPNLGTIFYSGTQADWDAYVTVGVGNESLLNSISYYSETDEQDGVISYWHYVDGVPTLWNSVSKGLEYKLLDDGTYSITGIGTCADTDLVIPKKYNMVPVTSIDTLAFDWCESLTSITISDTIISIGSTAFQGCTGLTEIVIPDGVKSISNQAFSGCNNLTRVIIGNGVTELSFGVFSHCDNLTNVTIPNSVTTIGDYAFEKCTGLTSIVIPNSVTSIGNYVFNSCDNLTDATIGHGVTTISNGAFYHCTSLASVTIGIGVTSIDKNAFNYCSALTNVYYRSDADKWQTITIQSGNDYLINATIYYGQAASTYCQYRINDDWTGYIAYAWNDDSDITQNRLDIESIVNNLPVVEIEDNAFFRHDEVVFAEIGSNVTYIGKNVLSECPNLQEIIIPTSVTYIGENALLNNNSDGGCQIIYTGNAIQWKAIVKGSPERQYDNVTFLAPLPTYTDEQGVTYESSSDNSYYVCTSIEDSAETYVAISGYINEIPVREIGNYAGYDCTTLTVVTIPDSVTTIGDGAFKYCRNLDDVTLGKDVANMTGEAFYGCENLTNITVDVNNEKFKSIDNNLYTKDGITLVLYAPGKRVARFIIPDDVKVIGSGAFGDCDTLTSITIPDGLTTIKRYAFDNCDGLTSITLPNSVTSIDEEAFWECSPIDIYVPWSEGEVANAPWGTIGEVYYNS